MARKEPLEPYSRIDTSEAKEMLDSGIDAIVIEGIVRSGDNNTRVGTERAR